MGNVFRRRTKPAQAPSSTTPQNTGGKGNDRMYRRHVTTLEPSTTENVDEKGNSHPPEVDELFKLILTQSKLIDEMSRMVDNISVDPGDESIYAYSWLNSSNMNDQDLVEPTSQPRVPGLTSTHIVSGTEILQSAEQDLVLPTYQTQVQGLTSTTVASGTEILQSAGTYEVELNWEGEPELQNLKKHCVKNPGHDKFIPVHKFDKEHLPDLYKHDLIIDLVKCLSTLTVRLRVDKISLARPNPPYPPKPRRDHLGRDCSINGTGHVTGSIVYSQETDTPCACAECLQSGNPVRSFGKMFIQTAAHVVYDDLEAANTTCYFNYVNDSDGLDTAIKVQGTKGVKIDVKEDRSWMVCYTHDLSLAKKLAFMSDNYQKLRKEISDKYCVNWSDIPEDKLTIIVSHPHGCSKYVTVGNMEGRLAAWDDNDWTQYSYTTSTCPGSSGAPIFMLGKHGYMDNHHHSGTVSDTGLNVSTFGLF